jgi:hypothetical protein
MKNLDNSLLLPPQPLSGLHLNMRFDKGTCRYDAACSDCRFLTANPILEPVRHGSLIQLKDKTARRILQAEALNIKCFYHRLLPGYIKNGRIKEKKIERVDQYFQRN